MVKISDKAFVAIEEFKKFVSHGKKPRFLTLNAKAEIEAKKGIEFKAQRASIRSITSIVDGILKNHSEELKSKDIHSILEALKRINKKIIKKYNNDWIWNKIIFFLLRGGKYVEIANCQVTRLENLKANAEMSELTAQKEQERIAQEKAQKEEQERIAKAKAQKEEQERIAKEKAKLEAEPAFPQADKPRLDINASMEAFLIEQQKARPAEKEMFTELLKMQKTVHSEIEQPFHATRLCANIFGDGLFRNRKFISKAFPDAQGIEAPGGQRAIWAFMQGIERYYNTRRRGLTLQEEQGFKQLIEGYHDFFLSSLIRLATKTAKANGDSTAADRWISLSATLLNEKMQAVKDGKKSRLYWVVGCEEHFVSLRFERLTSGRLVMGTFNLGAGVLQKGRAIAETRIHERHYKTPEETSELCKKLARVGTIGTIYEWIELMNKLATVPLEWQMDQEKVDPLSSVMPVQKKQKMGDCTCRGQWALLRKEFNRLFPADSSISYKSFKVFFQDDLLAEKNPLISLGKDENPEVYKYNETSILTEKEVFDICWRKHQKLIAQVAHVQKAKPIKEKDGVKNGTITFTVENSESTKFIPITMSMDDLFGSKNAVNIGRHPYFFERPLEGYKYLREENYYSIPNFYPAPHDFINYMMIPRCCLKIMKTKAGDRFLIGFNEYMDVEVLLDGKPYGQAKSYEEVMIREWKPGMSLSITFQGFKINLK